MSTAFLRESDLQEPDPLPPASALPAGAKNLMTAAGAERLRAELTRLTDERAALAGRGDEQETRRELRGLDQRIRNLQQSLRSAEVVTAPANLDGVVRFGATVKVRDTIGGEVSRYRIVGLDEARPEQGEVSWLSPIAKSLLNRRVGERFTFVAPRVQISLEILEVRYES